MPTEAVADLVERLIDRLDALDAADLDLEEDNEDCCASEDVIIKRDFLAIGDDTDAEEDNEDQESESEDEPIFPLRRHPEPQEDFVSVRRQLDVVIERKRAANGAWEAWA